MGLATWLGLCKDVADPEEILRASRRALAVKLLILPSGSVDGPSGLSVACAGAAALPAGPAEESIESRIASERACLGLGLG